MFSMANMMNPQFFFVIVKHLHPDICAGFSDITTKLYYIKMSRFKQYLPK